MRRGKSDLVPLLNSLARIDEDRSEYTKAEQLYQRSLKVLEDEGDEVELERRCVELLSNLAGVYRAQGRYLEAEVFFRQALGLAAKVFGADHVEVSTVFNNLAAAYSERRPAGWIDWLV